MSGYGGSGNYSWSATSLPPGLSMSTGGVISGSSTGNGSYNSSITIKDLTANLSFSYGYTLQVNAFAITSAATLPQGTIGTAYSTTFTAPACNNCTWSLSNGFLPAGLSLNSTTGVLSGTPQAYYNNAFRIRVSGAAGVVDRWTTLLIQSNLPIPLEITLPADIPNTILNTTANVALTAQGGTPPYTWTLDSGTLPAGVSIAGPGDTLGNLFPGFPYLVGRPMQPGTFTFTLRVTDAASASVTRAFTWPIAILSSSYSSLPLSGAPLTYNVAYNQPLLILGGTGTYSSFAIASGALPPGLSINSATGVISGTPLNTGSYSPFFQVTDSAGATLNQLLTITVGSGTPSTLNLGNSDSMTMQLGGTAYNQLNPSGGTPPYTYTPIGAYPAGCTIQVGNLLSGVNGTYQLACSPFAAGDYTLTLRMEDSSAAHNFAVRTMNIHVLPITLLSSTALATASVGVFYSAALLTTGNLAGVNANLAPGSAYPPGLSLASNAIAGTPTTAGNYSFTLIVTDSSGIGTPFTFSLPVSPIAITNPDIIPVSAIVNVPFSYQLTSSGGGASKTWSLDSGSSMPGGITLNSSGLLSGAASSMGNGIFKINAKVSDGANSITHPLTLFVRFASPYVLTIDPTLQDVRVGANLNLALNVAGGTPPYTWTVPAGSILPPGLALQGGPNLSFYSSAQTVGNIYLTGAPTTPGTFAFDLIATDAAGVQARCTFTLNVLALSILGGSLRSGTVGVGYSQQLTAVGGAPPYNFTYEPSVLGRDMLPAGLTASASGLISGTPTSTGDFNLYAVAHDSAGRAFRTAYSFSVSTSQGLRITSQPGPTWAVGVGPQLFLNIAGSSTYTWTVSSGSLPPGVTIGTTGSSPVLVGAPTMAGPYNFTLRATDIANAANVAERAYSIVVAPMLLNTHRATTLPPARTGTGYSYTFQPAGGTPPYTFSPVALAPLPPGLTVSAAGVLSGVPTAVGTYTPYVQIADSLGKTGLFPVRQLNVLGPGAVNPPQGRRFGFESASLNVPYGILIDEAVLSGTAPFTWTVADGSTLPPGLALKSAGGSNFLTGIPTATGSFTFTLNIADAMGQTATTIATLVVSPLSIAEPNLPNGIVGTPYTASFTPSGGTAPYTFSLAYWGPAPPGLTFGANGTFAGVPSQPGFYNMGIVVTDNTGQTVTLPRWITIDNPTSQAQGIGIAQGRILMSYVRTAPAPAPIAIDVTSTTGLLPWKAMIAGIPGATLSATTGAGTSLVNLTLNTVGLTAGTYAGAIGVTSAQSANGWENLQVTLTVIDPPPCTYTLNPTAGSVAAAGGSNSFGVSAGSLCAWTATASDPSWIAVTGSGTGAGSVGYTATANTAPTPRTGTITIAGQNSSATYSITQFGSACSYAISPATLSATSAGGDAMINVTASNAACAWPTAQVLASGFAIAPLTGTGNGTVTVSIPANLTSATVTRQAKIAGLDFTVTQSGINCTVGLDSTGASLGAGGGNGVVNVTTQATCSYSTVAGPNWISITSGATGAGGAPVPLTFSVAANSSTTPRTGTLTIGGQPFTISQDATPCSVTVDASALPGQFAMLGQFATIGVNANGANCSWTASSPVTWATVSPMSGRGNGTIAVTAFSNAGAPSTLRSTTLTVAGQSLGMSQAGTSCTYSLGSSTATVPFGGGNGSVSVTAPAVCTWSSAPDVSAPWLHITSSGNAGSTDVQFTADPNATSAPRTGTLTVAGKPYTVTEGAAPCNYVLVPTSTTLVSGGASSSFTFSTGTAGCSASALSYSNWLTVSTNTDVGGQSGTVNFTAVANSAGVPRAGSIQFGGQTFTVNQLAAQCAYSFTSYGVVYNSDPHDGSVVASQSAIGCTPQPTIDLPSIATLTSLTGPVNNIWTQTFHVTPFSSMVTAIRRAVITFNGTTFVIKQTSWR
jgi:large repetitive protein